MTPAITHEQALKLVRRSGQLGLNFDKFPAGFFLTIRGYYRDSLGAKGKNDVGMYDDMLAWVSEKDILPIQGNTDPSRVGWNGSLGKPFAMLVPGVWYFIRGPHKGRQPCFRQPTEENAQDFRIPGKGYFTVYRAKGQNQISQHTAPTESGYFAINIHDGGDENTSSWGCLTAPSKTFIPWATEIWARTREKKQDVLPMLLLENPEGGVQLLDSLK